MGKVPTKVPKFIKVSFGFLSCTATLPFLGILNHMRSTKLDPTLPKQAVSHIFQEKSHCTELKVLERYECSEIHICSKSRKCFVPSKIWKSKDGKIQNVAFWKFKMYWTYEFRMNCFFLPLIFLIGIFVTFFDWMFALRRHRTTIACTYVNIICRYVYLICKHPIQSDISIY